MAARNEFSFEPMLCDSVERPPEGPGWRYELKLDGFRAVGRKSGRSAQLWSRNQKDFTRRFPSLVKGVAGLPNDTVIDGEIAALDESSKPSFNLLQGFGDAQAIVLYAFDLIMQGKDVRMGPLDDRRQQLRENVQTLPDTIRFSETFHVPLSELMQAVRKHQLEGIVAKRASSRYRSGEPSADWLKWRANRGQEFVIGGYIPNGDVLDSLMVGYYDGRDLMYAASVRAGFQPELRRVLLPHLEKLRVHRCPFGNLPDRVKDTGVKALRSRRWLCVAVWNHSSWHESNSSNGRRRIDCVTRASPESGATKMLGKLYENLIFRKFPRTHYGTELRIYCDTGSVASYRYDNPSQVDRR